MQTIRTFINQGEASFVASLLQAHGFAATLLDEGSFQWNWAGGAIPIRLQVPDQQAAEAVAFLKETEAEQDSTMDDPDCASPDA